VQQAGLIDNGKYEIVLNQGFEERHVIYSIFSTLVQTNEL